MSDLVERLRSLAAVDNCQASLEAADEITRLTAEVEKLRAALKKINVGDDWAALIARAALEEKQ